jgi:PncC family amidohydrolase
MAEVGAQQAAQSSADDAAPLVVLAERLGPALRERGLTLATAESCTGGLVGHLITEVPGSSDYYRGGVVSYGDELKRELLGVAGHTLEQHGAVSAQVCLAMAEGARARLGASVAVAVTGIAGPTGGTDAKPVGLTYVAVAGEGGHEVRRFVWNGDRHANKLASVGACLELLLEYLAGGG